MKDEAIRRTASWLDGTASADGEKPVEIWGRVEIMGHRRYHGRITEVDHFGVKMIRIETPVSDAAPLLDEREVFATHLYGGSAIFGIMPMSEANARAWAKKETDDFAPPKQIPHWFDDDVTDADESDPS